MVFRWLAFFSLFSFSSITFILFQTLRDILDQNGFEKTLISAPDGGWSIAADIDKDPALAKAIYSVGWVEEF